MHFRPVNIPGMDSRAVYLGRARDMMGVVRNPAPTSMTVVEDNSSRASTFFCERLHCFNPYKLRSSHGPIRILRKDIV